VRCLTGSETVSDTTGQDFQDAHERRPHLLHRCCRVLTARTSGKRCMLTTKLASKGDLWVDLESLVQQFQPGSSPGAISQ
jgi:hypothetical protein